MGNIEPKYLSREEKREKEGFYEGSLGADLEPAVGTV